MENKKMYRLLAVISLFCFLSLAGTAQNYVSNGDFENGSSGWQFVTDGPATGTTVSGSGWENSDGVKITAPDAACSYWKQNVTVTPGNEYVLYGYVKGSSVSGGAGLVCLDDGYVRSTPVKTGDFNWHYLDIDFSAQSSSVEVRLNLGVNQTPSAGEVLFSTVALIDKSTDRMLILAGDTLYGSSPQLQEALSIYRGDIQLRQNYYSELIRIGPLGDYVIMEPEHLKALINFYHIGGGFDGMLIVGSEPDIPAVITRYAEDGLTGVSDLYYADISHQWPAPDIVNGVEIYKFYDNNWNLLGGKSISDYHPELFYSRLSARRVKIGDPSGKTEPELLADEAELIINYLQKVHAYRVNGENLDPVALDRGAYYYDDEMSWKSGRINDNYCDVEQMQKHVSHMEIFVDQEITTVAKYKSMLTDGYRFIMLGHHSDQFIEWEDGQHMDYYYGISELESDLLNIKANYLNLFACEEGAYASTQGIAKKYHAGYMLFYSDFLLNITANSFDGFDMSNPAFYSSIAAQQPIGKAFQNFMIAKQDQAQYPLSERMLFGDPLIVFNPKASTDHGPKILSDLRHLEATVGQTLVFTFNVADVVDNINDILLTLELDPAITSGCSYNTNTKTLTWTPVVADAGNIYSFKAVATDQAGNSYTEEFTIFVNYFANGLMTVNYSTNNFYNWTHSGTGTLDYNNSKFSLLQTYNPAITVDDSTTTYTQTVTNLEPYCEYKLLFFANTMLVDSTGNTFAETNQAYITIDEISERIEINDFFYTYQYKAQTATFVTGNNTSLTFNIHADENEANRILRLYMSGIKLYKTGESTPPSSELTLLYQNKEPDTSTNTLRPWFKLENDGASAVNMEDITLRYWYTKDNEYTQFYYCDWAQIGTSNITGTFVNITPVAGADAYFEIGFTAGAGTLAAGQNSGDIQFRIRNSWWSNYNQSDDYSFDQGMTTYGENLTVTAYINGDLVFGTEP